jgi:hypothetical protein
MPSRLTFNFRLLTFNSLAPLPLCTCAQPPRRGIALNLFFVPLCPCVTLFSFSFLLCPSVPLSLCVKFPLSLCAFALNLFAFCLLSSCSRCLGGSNFAFSAPVSPVPAVQMPKLAGGGCLPSSRRFWQIQRQAPLFPPSKSRHAAPASIVPAIHSGGKLANFAYDAKPTAPPIDAYMQNKI